MPNLHSISTKWNLYLSAHSPQAVGHIATIKPCIHELEDTVEDEDGVDGDGDGDGDGDWDGDGLDEQT